MTKPIVRTTTRSRRAAEAIRDRQDFRTGGSFYGEETGRLNAWSSGRLEGNDLDQFRLDMAFVDYVVWSYSTPIAWHWTNERTGESGWHVVTQKFSSTTTKHQSNLYLVPRKAETTAESIIRNAQQLV